MRGSAQLLRLEKLAKTASLRLTRFRPISLEPVWRVSEVAPNVVTEPAPFALFGRPIDLDELRWDEDIFTGFVFPTRVAAHRIRLDQFFDKGVDIKVPLEASRFHFGLQLAVMHRLHGSEAFFRTFRSLVLGWIEANPFLKGVNWLLPIEVAIRAVNWIVACNVFGGAFWTDSAFVEKVSVSLAQHAHFLQRFPETPRSAPATNHAVADYTGLLFLALTLSRGPRSGLWRRTAIGGLERSIREQVNGEGVHFEKSLPYHRFVLECFGSAAVVALGRGIRFSVPYYEKLASMLRYTAQYIQTDGRAPQLGDNDSARLLPFYPGDEHNHSHLFALGRAVFGPRIAPWVRVDASHDALLPRGGLRSGVSLATVPEEGCFHLPDSGVFVFRTRARHLLVALQPVGMGGQGGHNHVDAGSFTLALAGKDVVVDPGTYTYTRSLKERQAYRSPSMHNVSVTASDRADCYSSGYWDMKNYPEVLSVAASDRELRYAVRNAAGEEKSRRMEVLDAGLRVTDCCSAPFQSLLHLHPSLSVELRGKACYLGTVAKLEVGHGNVSKEIYQYSDGYGRRQPAARLLLTPDRGSRLEYTVALR